MNNLDEIPPEDEPRAYRQQSYPKRLLTVSAGSIMHVLQAFVLFFVVFSFLGVPADTDEAERLGNPVYTESAPALVAEVVEDSAAAAAGVRPGDQIVSIAGSPVTSFQDIGDLIADRIGRPVAIEVVRGSGTVELTATIGRHPEDRTRALLGVIREPTEVPSVTGGPVRSAVMAVEYTGSTLKHTTGALASFFTGGIGDFASSVVDGTTSRGGPAVGSGSGTGTSAGGGRAVDEGDQNRLVSIYGVARMGAGMSEDGMAGFLLLLAFVNISIGLLNMIPLLPLDGGHAAIATYERIRSIGGRRHMADVSRLLPLTYAVFTALIVIGVSAIYLDIVDPIRVG